jgi:hypothetical protein
MAALLPSFARPLPVQTGRSERVPTLLPGAAGSWGAAAWTPRSLATRFGQREVEALIDLPVDGVSLPEDQSRYQRRLRFVDLVERIEQAPPDRPCYLAYTRATDLLPECIGELDFPAITGPVAGQVDTRLWIGSGNTRSMLHSDLKDNLFAQVYGRKLALFVPFDESHYVYPFPDNLVNSQVDPERLDAARFPRFAEATVYGAIVGPGDVVFIPRGCWHYFRALEPSISVNHWFGEPVPAGAYLRLLARLGPRHWARTARDFVLHGLLGRPVGTTFFFSPPPTGKRLYDRLRHGNLSAGNDPALDDA